MKYRNHSSGLQVKFLEIIKVEKSRPNGKSGAKRTAVLLAVITAKPLPPLITKIGAKTLR
jgi:hypothetical protein